MDFRSFLKDNNVILDGGMGTLLQEAGLAAGEYPERWNITHSQLIRDIHKAYYDSGSNVVNTNTFGANSLKLSDAELEETVRAAVENAMAAREASVGAQMKFVSLDVGPTGKLLKPYGDLDFEDAVEIFSQVVRLGVKYGVDLITLETFNDSLETKAALLAVKESCSLPVIVTNAYGEDGKLMTGASPEAMVALLEGMGADVIGANCSLGPAQLRGVMERMLAVASVPVALKPNAGLPQWIDGKTVYGVSPCEFSGEVASMMRAGVRVAGGCCGTTPEHIKALSGAASEISPCAVTDKGISLISSYTHAVRLGGAPVIIGERINPTGKKRFKQALIENDMDYILGEGLAQAEKGADVLDVNVGLPDIDEKQMLCRTVMELQAVTDLPLQIDTADAAAMESAMRRYNGKPMVNSVSGKEESMRAVFPLVKKYGGLTVALTLDDSGIPSTAEGRLAIAERILSVAAEYGISKKDIVFDPLAMTVSADPLAAVETLRALRLIRERLGAHTSLGVSNVSFGLPMRDAVNSAFFAQSLENGLSAAIINPNSVQMMATYRAHCVLHGLDENCAGYIEFSSTVGEMKMIESAPRATALGGEGASELQRAIRRGLTKQAEELTAGLLSDRAPLEIVEREIIPALDQVGKGFEEHKVYLPQLLMSAEAAKSAFGVIKAEMESNAEHGEEKLTVVIATVEGDIHDIGKNIVKLLLENYGYRVVDLGRDVPSEAVLDAVLETGAPLVGLSALMTTTVPAMERTVSLLHSRVPECRVMVGGAVLNEEYAQRIGADAYASDAMQAVRYAEELQREIKK